MTLPPTPADAGPPPDPAHPDPANSDPADSGPLNSGPLNSDPADSGPANSGPANSSSVNSDPADSGPADSGPARADAGASGSSASSGHDRRTPVRRTSPTLSAPDGRALGPVFSPGLPDDRFPVLRVVPMPADANQHGDIFGGWIMAQVDIAGGVAAASHARGRVATVAVNSFQFKEPVLIGDLVSFYADIVRVGNTSLTVNVEVFAERNPAERQVVKVTEATLTYVATDAQRRPRQVPRS